MAIDATARATLLTYAIANRQDSWGRGIKKGQCPKPLPLNPLLTVFNTPAPYLWTHGLNLELSVTIYFQPHLLSHSVFALHYQPPQAPSAS